MYRTALAITAVAPAAPSQLLLQMADARTNVQGSRDTMQDYPFLPSTASTGSGVSEEAAAQFIRCPLCWT